MDKTIGSITIMVFVLTGLISENLANSQLAIVEQPKNVTIEVGQSIVMKCEFNKPVMCLWTRNGLLVRVSDRYKYVDDKTGEKTTCSIQIKNGHKIDSGPWICTFSSGASGQDPIVSNPAHVKLTEKAEDETTVQNMSTFKSTVTPTGKEKTNGGETSGFSDKIMWISVAGGLVALSLLNTVIVVCYRRRARSRRSSRKSSPSSSCPTSPIIINMGPNSIRRSTLNPPYTNESKLLPNDDYITPIAVAEMINNAKKGQKYEIQDKKDGKHHYQNLILNPEPNIYEEITDG